MSARKQQLNSLTRLRSSGEFNILAKSFSAKEQVNPSVGVGGLTDRSKSIASPLGHSNLLVSQELKPELQCQVPDFCMERSNSVVLQNQVQGVQELRSSVHPNPLNTQSPLTQATIQNYYENVRESWQSPISFKADQQTPKDTRLKLVSPPSTNQLKPRQDNECYY